jgi:hypothetical protein
LFQIEILKLRSFLLLTLKNLCFSVSKEVHYKSLLPQDQQLFLSLLYSQNLTFIP